VTRRRLAEPAAVSGLLAAEGVLFARNLHTATSYDEGVYLASMDALRHGQALGSEVFASQPPGFYLLLRLVGLFAGYSVTGTRAAFVLLALLGCVGAYALGRALAGIPGGFAASALLAILPPFPSEAMRVDADVPSVSLALVGLALAAWAFRPRAVLALPLLAGAVFALAVSVKLLVLVAVVPLAALALSRLPSRRALAAFGAGAAAVGAAFLIAYAGVLDSLWDGAVGFHRDARAYPSPVPNDEVLRHFLDFRTPAAWLVALGAAATVLAWRRAWPLWLWTAATVAFLLWQKPLFDHHLVLLCAALASAAGVALGGAIRDLPPRALCATAAVLLAALAVGGAQQAHRIGLRVTSEPEALRWATAQLRSCTGAVASDQPIAAFRAHRPLPGPLVDTSLVRLSTPSLPPARLLATRRSFLKQPALLAGLRGRFGRPRRHGAARFYGCPG
jgi:hypothetical protein